VRWPIVLTVAGAVIVAAVLWIAVRPGQPPATSERGGVIQTVTSGDLDIVLLSESGALRQGRNRFVIEFRRAGTTELIDVGTVRASANMPMPGMVMSSGLQLQATDVAGRFTATAEFGMAGAWQMAIEWEGPQGRGSVSFQGGVQ